MGQIGVDCKSNEITAVPKMLEVLHIEGAVVTMDAMGCQRDFMAQIIKKRGDYAISLKGNQRNLLADVEEFMADLPPETPTTHHKTLDFNHGRIETRECIATQDVKWLHERNDLSHLGSIYTIKATREEKKTGKKSVETRHFITSLTENAEELLKIILNVIKNWQNDKKIPVKRKMMRLLLDKKERTKILTLNS